MHFDDPSRLRSSEVGCRLQFAISSTDTIQEPERARDATMLASPNLAFDADLFNPSSGTQRSAFFPWDNAAGTSSSGNAGFASAGDRASDRISLGQADIRLRSQSGSHRGSISIPPGQDGSSFDVGLSPVSGNVIRPMEIDGFEFDGTPSPLSIASFARCFFLLKKCY